MKTLDITQKLRKELEKELKPDRFDHTLGVAYTSASLAMVHGANVEKALIAGFLHDCAKCLSHEEQLRIKMRKSWSAAKEEETKEEQRAKLIRRIAVGAFALFLFYFVFCTPLMQNVISGLFGK